MYVMSIIRQRPENADKNRIIWKQFQMCQGPFENALFLVWTDEKGRPLKAVPKKVPSYIVLFIRVSVRFSVSKRQKRIRKYVFLNEN